MWQRTKRLINSYLDDLINRTSNPDREVREITRAELARLMELEAQTRGSVKLLEKELAETELKMVGVSERERLAAERGDEASRSSATAEIAKLAEHCQFLRQQISEANLSVERARALRTERRRQGNELVTDTYLTSMNETVAGVQSPFSSTDPASTIDEMRARLGPTTSERDARIAELERELEAERARSQADELLARYKQASQSGEPNVLQQAPRPPAQPQTRTESAPTSRPLEEDDPEQPKTLGRDEGLLHPID